MNAVRMRNRMERRMDKDDVAMKIDDPLYTLLQGPLRATLTLTVLKELAPLRHRHHSTEQPRAHGAGHGQRRVALRPVALVLAHEAVPVARVEHSATIGDARTVDACGVPPAGREEERLAL